MAEVRDKWRSVSQRMEACVNERTSKLGVKGNALFLHTAVLQVGFLSLTGPSYRLKSDNNASIIK